MPMRRSHYNQVVSQCRTACQLGRVGYGRRERDTNLGRVVLFGNAHADAHIRLAKRRCDYVTGAKTPMDSWATAHSQRGHCRNGCCGAESRTNTVAFGAGIDMRLEFPNELQ